MALKTVNFLTILLICAALFDNALGWRTFWKGRRSGGNLVAPHTRTFSLPPDQWFHQKLDHFDQSNNALWKQVNA